MSDALDIYERIDRLRKNIAIKDDLIEAQSLLIGKLEDYVRELQEMLSEQPFYNEDYPEGD